MNGTQVTRRFESPPLQQGVTTNEPRVSLALLDALGADMIQTGGESTRARSIGFCLKLCSPLAALKESM